MALQELTFEEVSSIVPYDATAFEPADVGDSFLTDSMELAKEKGIGVPKPENFIKEKYENVEEVLDSYTSYMRQINSHVENRMREGRGNPEMAKNSAFKKGLGCYDFIKSLESASLDKEGVISNELFNESKNLIETATMGLILLDLHTFNINYSNLDKVKALDKFVNMGVLNPKSADLAMKVTSEACPGCAEYRTTFGFFGEGVKAEVFTIYSILSSKELIEEEGLEVVKASPNDDVLKGIDIGIRKKGEKNFMVLYDIKKAENPSSTGVCSITNKGGAIYAYESGYYAPSLVGDCGKYRVEQNVFNTARDNFFVIGRFPENFNASDDISEIENFDKREYIAFRDRLITETKFSINKWKGEQK